jgi:hypothetical protein
MSFTEWKYHTIFGVDARYSNYLVIPGVKLGEINLFSLKFKVSISMGKKNPLDKDLQFKGLDF